MIWNENNNKYSHWKWTLIRKSFLQFDKSKNKNKSFCFECYWKDYKTFFFRVYDVHRCLMNWNFCNEMELVATRDEARKKENVNSDEWLRERKLCCTEHDASKLSYVICSITWITIETSFNLQLFFFYFSFVEIRINDCTTNDVAVSLAFLYSIRFDATKICNGITLKANNNDEKKNLMRKQAII